MAAERYAAENGIVIMYWDGRIRSYRSGSTPCGPMMNPDYVPILIIVAFVVYPFAVMFLTVFIVSRTRREPFPNTGCKTVRNWWLCARCLVHIHIRPWKDPTGNRHRFMRPQPAA